jgi:hypothetical protein
MTANHGVIELHLDDAAVEKLWHAWHRLETEGIDAEMPKTGARPHVSLVVGTGLDFRKAEARLKQVCAKQAPCSLEFPYLGLFPGDQAVGFLGVAQTQDLLRLHTEVFSAVEGCFQETHPHFQPSSIVFHSTLALAISKRKVLSYWEVIDRLEFPGQALVEQIDLVEYFPAQVRASLRFGGG